MRIALQMLAALLLSYSNLSWSSDQEREKAHAEAISETLVVGEEVWLEADGQSFLSLYQGAEEAQKAAILMHGRGVHPNWSELIAPLRWSLPDHGWSTLSIQMPIAARDADFGAYLALFPEVPARIEAAIRYLQQQNYNDIVLIAHSMGAMMATHYLASDQETAETAAQGFIAIGLNAADVPPVSVPENISKIRIPMLDIYGSNDFPNVKSTAWVRASAADENPNYQQLEVDGADHFFTGQDEELLSAILTWLKQLNLGQ